MLPNSDEFPDFDDNLRQAFQRETELFFESIMREDRNVLDLLTADYTFVNERLARHYGIPNIYGSQFRRVTVTDEARKGLLGQGSILTVTSHAERTSPVVRGKWILDNILGTPPPPPPPDVPALKENEDGQKPRTMREQMEEHRANPVCASCHKVMDPLGFALENFDAVGAWRTRDAGRPDRRLGRAGRRHARSTAWSTLRKALLQPSRGVRRHDDREAADLRARPRPRLSRHAGGSRDRPRRGARATTGSRRSCSGIVQQHAVSDADEADAE